VPACPGSRDVQGGLLVRVAIVHDWLVTYAGSERVVEQMIALFPTADVYALIDFLPEADRQFLSGKAVTTSFLQRLPLARRKYPALLPLMPLAIEQFDLSAYDLIISSSHCVAKGVLTGPDQLHVSYVHTPMRYAWDGQHEYLKAEHLSRGPKSWFARWMLHKIRVWDTRTAHGVDSFVANSHFIARRIQKVYGRQAQVIHPPVDVEAFVPSENREDFYVTASRLVGYKKIDILVEAFAQLPDKKLIVIGDGPDMKKLRAKAPPNVSLVGHQAFWALRDYLQRARAFLFAAREDFGIVAVEAQAAGAPVIAFGQGGALETIRGLDTPRPTGVLFREQTPASVVQAIRTFENQQHRLHATECRANAARFGIERFRREFFDHVMSRWDIFRSQEFRPQRQPVAQTISDDASDDARPAYKSFRAA
jgi:glycosyltransferase involved in cell wall biosynthesis